LRNGEEAFIRAIVSSPLRNEIVADILRGSLAITGGSAEEQSHWLLDLSVLTRKLGHYKEAADLSGRAFEIRKVHLGVSHPLTVAAVLEMSDCDLEAGEYVRAERMCKDTLQTEGQAQRLSPALLRLKNNLASALLYQGRQDEAEPLLRELQLAYEKDDRLVRELYDVYSGLGVCYAKRGELDEAKLCATKSVALASQFYGNRSMVLGVALVNLGNVLLKAGFPAEAASALKAALDIYADILDDNHPWALNAALACFAALSESSGLSDAMDFLGDRLARTSHLDDCAVWFQTSIGVILEVIDRKDRSRFRVLLSHVHRLAADSPEGAWTGSLATRAAQKQFQTSRGGGRGGGTQRCDIHAGLHVPSRDTPRVVDPPRRRKHRSRLNHRQRFGLISMSAYRYVPA
jgi:tetratricopeptide (TPR) repeat protein